MAQRNKSEAGTIAWVDLQTPDLEGARKFYGDLLGWTFEGGTDPTTMFYTMAQKGGRNVAGMAKRSEQAPFPPVWSIYFATDDADETAKKVVDAGGTVMFAPMDVMDQGRMAFFIDPTGAYFGVWQSKLHTGAQVIAEPGAMCWHEVYSRDVKKAREFYARVFSLEPKRLDAPNVEYWTLHKGPNTICGVMQMTEQMPKDVPSHWNAYFAVEDAEAAVQKVTALGGKVMQPPFDTPYGRMAAVADPYGAPFCLIKMAMQK